MTLYLRLIHKMHYYWAAPFQGMRSYLFGFRFSVQKNSLPGGGKTRGSGTEKRCSHKWFHTVRIVPLH